MDFYRGQMALLWPNQQCQSTEGKSQNWPQPVAWPHPLFIYHRSLKGRALLPLCSLTEASSTSVPWCCLNNNVKSMSLSSESIHKSAVDSHKQSHITVTASTVIKLRCQNTMAFSGSALMLEKSNRFSRSSSISPTTALHRQ